MGGWVKGWKNGRVSGWVDGKMQMVRRWKGGDSWWGGWIEGDRGGMDGICSWVKGEVVGGMSGWKGGW